MDGLQPLLYNNCMIGIEMGPSLIEMVSLFYVQPKAINFRGKMEGGSITTIEFVTTLYVHNGSNVPGY